MYRRCISSLLLVAYVAGQWAVMPHAHGDESATLSQKHSSRPHVHLGTVRHDHASHHHDHPHSHGKSAVGQVLKLAAGQCVITDPHDHDADAVYLASSVNSITVGKVGSQTLNVARPAMHLNWMVLAAELDQPTFGENWHPPAFRIAGCDFILALRALRI